MDRERAFLVATGLIIGILAAVLVVMETQTWVLHCLFPEDITGALGFSRPGGTCRDPRLVIALLSPLSRPGNSGAGGFQPW